MTAVRTGELKVHDGGQEQERAQALAAPLAVRLLLLPSSPGIWIFDLFPAIGEGLGISCCRLCACVRACVRARTRCGDGTYSTNAVSAYTSSSSKSPPELLSAMPAAFGSEIERSLRTESDRRTCTLRHFRRMMITTNPTPHTASSEKNTKIGSESIKA